MQAPAVVRMRVVWSGRGANTAADGEETSGQQVPQQFNESLRTEISASGFSAWRQRLAEKFSVRKGLRLSWSTGEGSPAQASSSDAISLPLETLEDVKVLQLHYAQGQARSVEPAAKTYRILVRAQPATAPSRPHGVHTRTRKASPLQEAPLPQEASGRQHRVREDSATGLTPAPKKLNRGGSIVRQLSKDVPLSAPKDVTPSPAKEVTPSPAKDKDNQAGVCWAETVLRSIAKTIDKHHFVAKLALPDTDADGGS